MIYERELVELNNEESSIGVIRKWYDSTNGVFIKSSTINAVTNKLHIEYVMECMASDIGNLLNIKVVDYYSDVLQLADGTAIPVCVSDDYKFKEHIHATISANSLFLKSNTNTNVRSELYFKLIKLYPNIRERINQMIIFDYIIDNRDRHLRNFELMYTYDDTVKLSPLFDNGSSLLSDWVDDEDLSDLRDDEDLFEENIIDADTVSKCFAHSHREELRLIERKHLPKINLDIKDEEFNKLVKRYESYLTPLRIEMIIKLVTTRYANVKKLYR